MSLQFRLNELQRVMTKLNSLGVTLVAIEKTGASGEQLVFTLPSTPNGPTVTLYADGATYQVPTVLTPSSTPLP